MCARDASQRPGSLLCRQCNRDPFAVCSKSGSSCDCLPPAPQLGPTVCAVTLLPCH